MSHGTPSLSQSGGVIGSGTAGGGLSGSSGRMSEAEAEGAFKKSSFEHGEFKVRDAALGDGWIEEGLTFDWGMLSGFDTEQKTDGSILSHYIAYLTMADLAHKVDLWIG